MATKILRKISPVARTMQHPISHTPIYQYSLNRNRSSFRVIDSIKPTINIKLDAYGRPSISEINLGNQHDHNVTWMNFDLSDLLWQIQTNYNPDDNVGYEEEHYYALYDFKLVFKHLALQTTTSWEFDGINFKIPKEITSQAGKYEIALVIRERMQDDEEGNIPDDLPIDAHETFISQSWFGSVTTTFFHPELIEGLEKIEVDTNQLKALIKPAIDCVLADDGFFSIDYEVNSDHSLGIYNDNLIRYLRLKKDRFSAHLEKFDVYAIFKQNDKISISIFESTSTTDPKDDSAPFIAWVPSEVYDSAGQWRIMIVAVSPDYTTDNEDADDYTDLFYRYISSSITMNVEPGFIEDMILVKDADEEYYISSFVTADEAVIIGSDNAILRGEE